jgi:hypothetical protein
MALINTPLTTTIANIYVSSGNTVIPVVYFCNTYSAAINFNLYAVPSGTSTINSNVQIYNNIQLASGDTYVMDWEKLVLGNGDTLRANITSGTANLQVTATVSYVGV